MRHVLLLLAVLGGAWGCNTEPTLMENINLERDLMAYGYSVVKVVTGDAFLIDLSDKGDPASFRRVRLAGIDAPSFGDVKERGGRDALAYLKRLLSDKRVVLRFDTAYYGPSLDPSPHDHPLPNGAFVDPESGDILAHVLIRGESVNRMVLIRGLAKVAKRYPFARPSIRDDFLAFEKAAQDKHLGIWR
jgi:endonuclease YncB( thermonuclease family)